LLLFWALLFLALTSCACSFAINFPEFAPKTATAGCAGLVLVMLARLLLMQHLCGDLS
jgi:hypothetical protein